MGTRSLTHFFMEGYKKPILTVYRQMDGYMSGHGRELYDILKDGKITNGYGFGMQCPKTFNGMGCLAAYTIGALKDGQIGSIYVYPPHVKQNVDQEYTYSIYIEGDLPHIKVAGRYQKKILYKGPIKDMFKQGKKNAKAALISG